MATRVPDKIRRVDTKEDELNVNAEPQARAALSRRFRNLGDILPHVACDPNVRLGFITP